MKKNLFVPAAVALALAAPLVAHAESQLVIGGTGSAAVDLNLRVIIPRVLFLGVGTGAALPMSTNGTIDTVTFDYSTNPLDVGSGPGATAGSISNTGPLPVGASIPVRVFGNDGEITITASYPAVLSSGADTIPITELLVSSSSTDLPAPTFSGGSSTPTLTAGRVTNRTANWTYSYANTTTPAFGTYTGTVTYTATMP